MTAQNKRTTGKEQYYTPDSVSEYCLSIMDKYVVADQYLEPAGGTGSFIRAVENKGRSVVSYDIEPKHDGIIQTPDFLLESIDHLDGCVTITNPPFGRANALAIPFFNKCAEVSTHIGFLIPKSWRKWSVINRLNPYFHLVDDVELDVDFIYDDDTPKKSKGKLNTIFQVWEKRDTRREKLGAVDRGYITKTTPDVADVSLTAFGRGCGTVKRDFPRKKNTTQMFLRVNEPWVYQALEEIDYNRFYQNTAFIEALSIQEINHLLNEYHDNN